MMPEIIEVEKKEKGNIAVASIIQTALSEGGDLLKQLLQTAMTNGLMGVVVALIVLDLLHKGKNDSTGQHIKDSGIISDFSFNLAVGLIVASAGVDLASNVITALEGVLPSFTAKSLSPNLAIPQTQVLVIGNASPSDQLNALLKALPK